MENPRNVVLTDLEVEILSSYVLYSNVYKETNNESDLTPYERFVGRILLFSCDTGIRFVDFNNLTIQNIYITEDKDLKLKSVNVKFSSKKLKNTIDYTLPINGRTIDLLNVMLCYTYFGVDFDRKNPFSESGVKEENLMKLIDSITNSSKNLDNSISKVYPRILPKISLMDFNKEIKEVLKKIGINDMVKIQKYSSKKLVEIYKEKWSLVSSNTGRRTYLKNNTNKD